MGLHSLYAVVIDGIEPIHHLVKVDQDLFLDSYGLWTEQQLIDAWKNAGTVTLVDEGTDVGDNNLADSKFDFSRPMALYLSQKVKEYKATGIF